MFQTFQRTGTNGSFVVSGNVGTGTHDIQARFNGAAWTTIASSASGTYSATLTNQIQGQGWLEVRWADKPWQEVGVNYVGIGDLFLVAGQSNAGGRGTNPQSYSSGNGIKATLFGNDYLWHDLTDPTDNRTNQVDIVSRDSGMGSVWPLVATFVLTNNGCPIAFIPCALSATASGSWLPGSNHQDRTTLYGSMVYRGIQVGGVKAVLWWQGETDATLGHSQAVYFNNLTNITASIKVDLGVNLMPCKFQTCSDPPTNAGEGVIWSAIGQAWAGDTNTITGPDFTSLTTAPEDTFHLITDSKLASAASLWFATMKTAFSW